MSEKMQVSMVLDPFVFEQMMTEDDYKVHIKIGLCIGHEVN